MSDHRADRYDPSAIEPKWQRFWEEQGTFHTPRLPGARKHYVLDMFPYPSGSGLHVGHPEGYTATDIVARFRRARGETVLHPMGWDAFGLPAEQHAIRTGTHPAETTRRNIDTFRRQLRMLGFSYDWSREVDTTDPSYVRWTQWIFLKLFHRGLAYQAEIPVNWCPALGTVLANEEVVDGRSEVGGHPVERVPLRQWMLRITAYADRLLEDLERVDWPQSTKTMQREWIGRSEGALLRFPLGEGQEQALEVFTTRPDTLYGATFVVVAPEHPLLDRLTSEERRSEVADYVARARRKSDLERKAAREKSGVRTGGLVHHPITGVPLPVFVADYVLMDYGTGAIMAVPAHDERDFAFARRHGLPIVEVIAPDGTPSAEPLEAAYTGPGVLVNSGAHSGLSSEQAKSAITDALAARGLGERRVQYKLRDWVFSRQRYWGEPIPIYFPVETAGDPRQGASYRIRYDQPIAVDESELPVRLPDLEDFRPGEDPAGPLARAVDWRFFQREGRWYARETNTMPQWAGSCWYYLRFVDPHNERAPFDPEVADAWLPVDLYVGGAEHAVLHLLYARFWHKVLFDEGLVRHPEPFAKLVHQGMILGELEFTRYRDAQGRPISAERVERVEGEPRLVGSGAPLRAERVPESEVRKEEGRFVLASSPEVAVEARAHKMSKSRGNVVNPDEIVRRFGADAMRAYEMFMGPLEATKPWSTRSIQGVRRFLERVWDVALRAEDDAEVPAALDRLVHRTIRKVTEDIEAMRFNTAISAMMVLAGELHRAPAPPRQAVERLLLLLHPFCPHVAEELWERIGHEPSIQAAPWPEYDPARCEEPEVEVPVQVSGKVRGRLRLPKGTDEETALRLARQDPNVARFLEGRPLRRVVWVPDKILNLIV